MGKRAVLPQSLQWSLGGIEWKSKPVMDAPSERPSQPSKQVSMYRWSGYSAHKRIRWTLLIGAQATFQGQGAVYTVPLGSGFELGYSPKPSGKRFQTTVLVRGSWSIGHVGDDDNSTGLEQSGWFTTGAAWA